MRTVKTLKYLLLVVIFTSLVGCNEWLNLKPESEIILDEYWQNESDVDFVLSACYRGLTEESVIYRMRNYAKNMRNYADHFKTTLSFKKYLDFQMKLQRLAQNMTTKQ